MGKNRNTFSIYNCTTMSYVFNSILSTQPLSHMFTNQNCFYFLNTQIILRNIQPPRVTPFSTWTPFIEWGTFYIAIELHSFTLRSPIIMVWLLTDHKLTLVVHETLICPCYPVLGVDKIQSFGECLLAYVTCHRLVGLVWVGMMR